MVKNTMCQKPDTSFCCLKLTCSSSKLDIPASLTVRFMPTPDLTGKREGLGIFEAASGFFCNQQTKQYNNSNGPDSDSVSHFLLQFPCERGIDKEGELSTVKARVFSNAFAPFPTTHAQQYLTTIVRVCARMQLLYIALEEVGGPATRWVDLAQFRVTVTACSACFCRSDVCFRSSRDEL